MPNSLARIEQQIAALEKEKQGLIRKEKASVIQEIMTKIMHYQITPQELGLGAHAPRTPRRVNGKARSKTAGIRVPVKYKLGEHSWTGRGRQPRWFAEYVAKGKPAEDLLVKHH